jgi:type IV pilus assembly protein PilQ
MGDVVNSRQSVRWQGLVAAAVLTVAAMSGCTSSKPPAKAKVVEATPAPRDVPAEAKSAPAPAEIRSMDLREGAPEVFVDLEANAPLVWTSFRNAEGKVVVELPNSRPGAAVANLAPAEGLVSSIEVQKDDEGSRPLTRLVIATRQEVEHSVTANGPALQVRLLPVEEKQAKAKLAFEPVPEAARAAEKPAGEKPAPAKGAESAVAAAPPARPGTPDAPAVAAAPKGVPATRLEGIEVLASEGGAVVRIAGDGEFPYSTFALAEPARFVIDLDGVINRSPKAAVPVGGSVVERVRVAQFKPLPKPVARIVFDLKTASVPVVERTAEALVVSFPPGGTAAPASARSAAAAAAAPTPPEPAPAPAPAVRSTVPARPPAVVAEPSDLALKPRPAATQAAAAPARRESIEVNEIEPGAAATARSGGAPPAAPTPAKAAPPAAAKSTPLASAGAKPNVQVQPAAAGPAAPVQSFASQTLGQGERVYTGEPIDLKVTNADVTDVLRTFAQISGLNVVVQPGVTGTVTAELQNVPWDQALEEVLKINNLGYELEGNVMRIAPTPVLRQEAQERQQLEAAKALSIPLKTIFRRLSYADAEKVAGLLRSGQAGLLSQRGSVVVDVRTNALIIKELPNFMDAVVSVIDLLDTPEPQVMIEARIIETTKNFNRSLGITWGFEGLADAAHGNTTGLVFPSNADVTGRVNVGTAGNNGALNLRLGNVLNTFQLDAALQAAETEGLINILSAPKVATLNNQQASIQSGLQIPIQTIANNTVTVQFVNATLRLDVTPQVTAEGTVMMTINISKREPQLAFLVPGATNAPIATKDASTRLVVRDGGTAVIGGIYKVTTNANEDRVPGLANIPIIGHLFKNRSRSEQNEELLIFITPRVIKL